MAYITNNLTRISPQIAVTLFGGVVPPPSPGIASSGSYYGNWQYQTNDYPGAVCGANYFSDGMAKGVNLGDRIFVVKVPEMTVTAMIVTNLAFGGATVSPYIQISSVPVIPSRLGNYFQKKAVVVDDMTNANANWSIFNGAMTKADSSEFTKLDLNCTNALKCNMTGNFCRIQRTISAVFTGTIDVWFYLPADPNAASNVTIAVSKDAFATTNIAWLATAALFLRAGWNRISLNVAETTGATYQTGAGATPIITGATTFADTMNTIRITLSSFEQNSPTTGAPIPVYIGGIFYGGESKPNVVFNWDDAWASQWDIFNIFRSRGLTGSISVIPQAVNNGGLTLSQLRTIYDWGWDVVNHTMQATSGNLMNQTDDEVRAKIGGARDWMLANGFSRTANVLVWPENAYTDRLIGIAKEYGITICRGSRNMNTRTFQGIDNILRMGSSDFGGKTLAQAKTLLDGAQLYTGTIIIYGHKMVGTPTSPAPGGTPPADTLEWYQSDYLAFADDVAARITAGTISNINYSQLQENCRNINGQ